MGAERYTQTVSAAEARLLRFLETLDDIQENMRVELLGEFQDRLRETASDMFSTTPVELAEHAPPESLARFHQSFVAAVRHCGNACESFLNSDEESFPLRSIDTRRSLYRALDLLYNLREHTPILRSYWLLPEAMPRQDELEARQPDAGAPVGIIHNKRTKPLADYSLYVPEGYTPEREWPLIVCLHGAYGRGDHHIWSWLRAAKSQSYMLLAPKSIDVTWSILQPPRDVNSVAGMFEEVCRSYSVDRSRVFLSGLSDGGTFTYLLGLSRPEMFAGIAPVAADFHGMLDDMVRKKQGANLPIYIVHGAHDHIFPVDSIRRGKALLDRLGYNATYKELPDWGHSYCAGINSGLVMPWFEGLSEL